jgi:hypothetical protein
MVKWYMFGFLLPDTYNLFVYQALNSLEFIWLFASVSLTFKFKMCRLLGYSTKIWWWDFNHSLWTYQDRRNAVGTLDDYSSTHVLQ